jgi:hypothetical protein
MSAWRNITILLPRDTPDVAESIKKAVRSIPGMVRYFDYTKHWDYEVLGASLPEGNRKLRENKLFAEATSVYSLALLVREYGKIKGVPSTEVITKNGQVWESPSGGFLSPFDEGVKKPLKKWAKTYARLLEQSGPDTTVVLAHAVTSGCR